MITVNILINGNCILARTAVRICTKPDGTAQYKTDCNHIIEHNPIEGPVKLAHKMLDLLKDVPHS